MRKHLQGQIRERDIIAVTSKVVSLSENRCVQKSQMDKLTLVRQEAEQYLGEISYDCHLTIKCGHLIPSAGIDESNSQDGSYILYPSDPFASAKKIHQFLKKTFQIKKLGVILTDSRTYPLRQGVIGAALSYYGFKGVESQVGEKDLYGRELKMTKINVADALAASATLLMGEGSECRPLARLNAPVHFIELDDNKEIMIDKEKDLYWPLLKNGIAHSMVKDLG